MKKVWIICLIAAVIVGLGVFFVLTRDGAGDEVYEPAREIGDNIRLELVAARDSELVLAISNHTTYRLHRFAFAFEYFEGGEWKRPQEHGPGLPPWMVFPIVLEALSIDVHSLCLQSYVNPIQEGRRHRVIASMELAQLREGVWTGAGFHVLEMEFEGEKMAAQWETITLDQAYEMMATLDSFILLDVRTPEEFEGGHLEGAVNIPYDELHLITADLHEPILIYCRSGRRSAIAAQTLTQKDFTRVYDFGGIE